MQERYYYCQGFCETLSLNSLNPILYQGEGEKSVEYKKVKMACSAIENGTCDMAENCKVFFDAPEMMEDDGANMVKAKYHAV